MKTMESLTGFVRSLVKQEKKYMDGLVTYSVRKNKNNVVITFKPKYKTSTINFKSFFYPTDTNHTIIEGLKRTFNSIHRDFNRSREV